MSEFLAEASVLIRPDTTAFRAALEAQLLAATRGIPPVVVPVVATGGTGVAASTAALVAVQKEAQESTLGLASAAQVETTAFGRQATVLSAVAIDTEKLAAAQQVAGANAAKAAAATNALTRAQAVGATAVRRLGLSFVDESISTSALGAARTRLTAANTAVIAGERAVSAAVTAGNIALIDAASNTLTLATARKAEAVSAVQAAIAERQLSSSAGRLAASEAQVARGAGATALSLLGARGATLAASSSFLVGAAAAVTLAKSVGLAASFERTLNVFRVTAQATSAEMEKVGKAAEELGTDMTLPSVSASDAAEAMTELAKAGLSVEQSIAAARGTLQLATAAQLDNAQATEITANALNAFGLEGTKAIHVADLLAAASIAAQGSIGDMGAALTQTASVSRQVGVSLDDTVALLTLLAKNGITGAGAGTLLRVALLRLVNPTRQSAKFFKDLGVNIRDAQGQVRPEVFSELETALASLTKAQRDAAEAQIFGFRGIRAQAIFGREGLAGLQQARDDVEKEGAASEIAGAQTQGFSGKVENLKNQAEALGLTLGKVTVPAFGLLVDTFALAAEQANASASAIEGSVSQLKGFGSAALDAGKNIDSFLAKLTGLPSLGDLFGGLTGSADDADRKMEHLTARTGLFGAAARMAASDTDDLSSALHGLSLAATGTFGKIAGLEEKALDLSFSGSKQSELANQKRELAVIQDRLKAGNLSIKARRELKRERDRVNSEIERIENEIGAAAEDSARKQEQSIRDAADARQKADQDIVNSFGTAQARATLNEAKISASAGLKDDIALSNTLVRLFKAEIREAEKRISDLKTRNSIVLALEKQLKDELAKRRDLKKEQAQDIQDAQARAADARLQALQIEVQTTSITGNKAKQEKLLKLEIEELTRQIKAAKGNRLKRLQLIQERAQARKDLEELRKKTDDNTKASTALQQAEFAFLQTQQGFVSNLLSNLIPQGATAGLVGGGSGPVSAIQGQRPLPQQAVAQERTAAQGTQLRGATAGQLQTTNDKLEKILKAIQALNQNNQHPEAKHQRKVGSAIMDNVGGV